jgi:hypothetical protein
MKTQKDKQFWPYFGHRFSRQDHFVGTQTEVGMIPQVFATGHLGIVTLLSPTAGFLMQHFRYKIFKINPPPPSCGGNH